MSYGLGSMNVRLISDGTADFTGIDWDNKSKPILIWHQDDNYIVFKIPGGKHWVSITEGWQPHPGKYMVTEVERIDPNSTALKHDVRNRTYHLAMVRELFDMPLSARGRED